MFNDICGYLYSTSIDIPYFCYDKVSKLIEKSDNDIVVN